MTRQTVTWEPNAELVAIVRHMGQALGISAAGVVDRLLLEGLQRYAAGEIDFEGYLRPSRGPRYLWVVEVPTDGLQERVCRHLAEMLPGDGERRP
jgi:hypothetical protein